MNNDTVNGGDDSAQEESDTYDHSLLIEEPPLQVLPSLAEAIGLEESIIIQQLHYLLRNKKFGKEVNGHRWIYNTYTEWHEEFFPFWSESTIERIFRRLESMGIVISCQPEGKFSRRKYYRVGAGVMNLIRKGKLKKPKRRSKHDKLPSRQVDALVTSTCALPYIRAKTTSKQSKDIHTGTVAPVEFPPEFKLDSRSKEDQLKTIKPKPNFPTQLEFQDFIAEHCEGMENYRCPAELYVLLCKEKWHEWSGHGWKQINSWQQYVMGLYRTIMGGRGGVA